MSKDSEIRKIKKEISELNDEVQRALATIPRKLEELQIRMVHAINLDEDSENYQHNFTHITMEEALDRVNDPDTRNLSKIIKRTKQPTQTKLCLVGTDGSYREANRQAYSIAAAYFSPTSSINLAIQIPGDGTSLLPELHAINLALKTVKEAQIKHVNLVVDNAVAINECHNFINRAPSQSPMVQNAIQRSIKHHKILTEIKKMQITWIHL